MQAQLQAGSASDAYYRFHPRVWDHPGAVVDLGCLGWDWSRIFLGKKRVIGADPIEVITPPGADLFKGFVCIADGRIRYQRLPTHRQESTGVFFPNETGPFADSEALAWASFVRLFRIDNIALLKLNIEGMEYPLLASLREPPADQLVVAFHDQGHACEFPRRNTTAILAMLSDWYDWCESDPAQRWYVFVRKP